MWAKIPEGVKLLHEIFSKNGKQLYVVGGAVRDFLTGDSPKDFDLCTDATPDQVISILDGQFRTNIQGKAFGVVAVMMNDGWIFEIATFRSETYDGQTRNPMVVFTTIEEDVKRRDLTINALFYDLDKKLIVDLVGGQDDLKNKVIRMVGQPALRIQEDPLRIMRAVRFAHRYYFKIEEETRREITAQKSHLSRVSRERIWEEIRKAYLGTRINGFDYFLNKLTELDLMSEIFPSLIIRPSKGSLFDRDISLSLASVLIENDPYQLHKKLILEFKIDTETASKICFLIKLAKITPESAYLLYKEKIRCNIEMAALHDWSMMMQLNSDEIGAFFRYRPTTSAEELMKFGFTGALLGREIHRIETNRFRSLLDP